MLEYGFMQNAFVVSLFISVLCPCIGVFLVLRRYSMIGDTAPLKEIAAIKCSTVLIDAPASLRIAVESVVSPTWWKRAGMSAAIRAICLPVLVPPVKDTRLISG